jgi:hypothetical protein
MEPRNGAKDASCTVLSPRSGAWLHSFATQCLLGYILTLLRSYIGFRSTWNLNCWAVHLSGESLFPSEGLQTRELV